MKSYRFKKFSSALLIGFYSTIIATSPFNIKPENSGNNSSIIPSELIHLATKYNIEKTCSVSYPDIRKEAIHSISTNLGGVTFNLITSTAVGYIAGKVTANMALNMIDIVNSKLIKKTDDITDIAKKSDEIKDTVNKAEKSSILTFKKSNIKNIVKTAPSIFQIEGNGYKGYVSNAIAIATAIHSPLLSITNGVDSIVIDNYLPPDDLYKLERRLTSELVSYTYNLLNCYTVDESERSLIEKIVRNLEELDRMTEDTRRSSNIGLIVKTATIGSSNNWTEFKEKYKETLELINKLKIGVQSINALSVDNAKISQIKQKIISGDFVPEDLSQLNSKELKVLLNDPDVFKKLSEEYPNLSEEIQKKLSNYVRDIIKVPPEFTSTISNLINIVSSFNGYVNIQNIIKELEIYYNDPFLTQEKVNELIDFTKNELYYTLKSSYSELIPPYDKFWNDLNELKNARSIDELLKISKEIKKDLDNFNAINNFDKFYQEKAELIKAINHAINKYNINLIDESSELTRALNELKDYKTRKNPKKVRELLNKISEAEDKARYKFEETFKETPEQFLEINKERPVIKEVNIKDNIINARISRQINIKVLDKELLPLMEGIKVKLYEIKNDGRGIYNLKVGTDSDLLSLIEKKDSIVFEIYGIFNNVDKDSGKVFIEYNKDIGTLEKDISVEKLGTQSEGSIVKIKVKVNTFNNETFNGIIPIKTGIKDLKSIRGIIATKNFILLNLNEENSKEVDVLDLSLYYEKKLGKEKPYFSEKKGKMKIKSIEYIIHNYDNNVYRNVPLNINNIDEDAEDLYVFDSEGNIIYHVPSEKLTTGNYIVKIPLVYPGDNHIYVKEIIQDKQIKMERTLNEYKKKLDNINEYIEKVKKVSNDDLPQDINELLIKVQNEINNLEDAVKNQNYEEYTRIVNNLNYDYQDLYSKVMKWVGDKLGKEKATKMLIKEMEDKLNEANKLLINSKSAFTETEYNQFLNQYNSFRESLNSIETNLQYKELDTAYEDAVQLKPQVDSFLNLLRTKIVTVKSLKISSLDIKITNLEMLLKRAIQYGDTNAQFLLNQIKAYKKTLDEVRNNNDITLENLLSILNTVDNQVETIKTKINIIYKDKVTDLYNQVVEENKKIKETYNNIKRKLQLFEMLGVPADQTKELREKLYDIENKLTDIDNGLEKVKNIDNVLQKYVYLLEIKKQLDSINIKYESNLDILYKDLIKQMKKEVESTKLDLIEVINKAKENKNSETYRKAVELLNQINQIESELDSIDTFTEIKKEKDKLEDIKKQTEELKTMVTVSGIANKTKSWLYIIFMIFLIIIGYGIYKKRDEVVKNIKNLFKKKDGNQKGKDSKKSGKEQNIEKKEETSQIIKPISKPLAIEKKSNEKKEESQDNKDNEKNNDDIKFKKFSDFLNKK
jgi:hypothetical protein